MNLPPIMKNTTGFSIIISSSLYRWSTLTALWLAIQGVLWQDWIWIEDGLSQIRSCIQRFTTSRTICNLWRNSAQASLYSVIYMATINRWMLSYMVVTKLRTKDFYHGPKLVSYPKSLLQSSPFSNSISVFSPKKSLSTTQLEWLSGTNSK